MLVVRMLLPRFLVLEVVLFFHFLRQGHGRRGISCSISSRNVIEIEKQKRMPLLFDPKSESFVFPHRRQGVWNYVIDKDVVVGCPGAKIRTLRGRVSHQRVECAGGSRFRLPDGRRVPLDELSCSRSIRETLEATDAKCGPPSENGKLVHIGWRSGTNAFVPQISVCHDASREHSYYTNHTLVGASIEGRYGGDRDAGFKEGEGFFKRSSASSAYKVRNQSKMFSRHLSDARKRRVFRPRSQLFLSKGHLSPKADFVFKEWQDATFYFFNAAPQWQAVNGGNWVAVEQRVRKLASSMNSDLEVFTGTHGRLSLGGEDVYMAQEEFIPVPLYFWKIVHDPESEASIVFISVNDPHLSSSQDVPSLCLEEGPSTCESNGWTFKDRRDLSKGLLYCCSLKEFVQSIPWVKSLVPETGKVLRLSSST